MAVGWIGEQWLVDTVCLFRNIGICDDTAQQHQPDDTYLQPFCVGCLHSAIVYCGMAVSIGPWGLDTIRHHADTTAAVLVLSRHRVERQDILYVHDSERHQLTGAPLSAVYTYYMAANGVDGLLYAAPCVI